MMTFRKVNADLYKQLPRRKVVTYSEENSKNLVAEKKQYAVHLERLDAQMKADITRLDTLSKDNERLKELIAKHRDDIDKQVDADYQKKQADEAKSGGLLKTVVSGAATVATAKTLGINLLEEVTEEIKLFVKEETAEHKSHLLSYEVQSQANVDEQVRALSNRLTQEQKLKKKMIRAMETLERQVTTDIPAFLAKLKDEKECPSLIRDVQQSIAGFVTEYETHNAVGQSEIIRHVFLQLESSLDRINQAQDTTLAHHQCKYLELASVLWAMEDFFAEETKFRRLTDKEEYVRGRLFLILDQMHIDRDCGLPDQLSTVARNRTCAMIIEANKTARTPFCDDDMNAFHKRENALYDLEVNALQLKLEAIRGRMQAIEREVSAAYDSEHDNEGLQRPTPAPELKTTEQDRLLKRRKAIAEILANHHEYQMCSLSYSQGKGLLDFCEKKDSSGRKGSDSDKHFYTRVLHEANALMQGGVQRPNLMQLGVFAEQAPGTPSTKRKVFGFLLGLAGIALIGASVFSAVATLGGATPVSLLGIKFGASLIVAGAAYAAGLTVGGVGEYLFLNGMRRGASEKIRNVYNAAVARDGKDGRTPVDLPVPSSPVSVPAATPAALITGEKSQPQSPTSKTSDISGSRVVEGSPPAPELKSVAAGVVAITVSPPSPRQLVGAAHRLLPPPAQTATPSAASESSDFIGDHVVNGTAAANTGSRHPVVQPSHTYGHGIANRR
jgi:hypothetical protein